MSLARYRKIRNFSATNEPAGKSRRESGRSYVIQKHDASHLHYDFRLELGGVLLSWAVPKGPSLDPSVKRLAMQTEDHPVEYGGFEGTIPEGAYGGGTVMVWDRGTWEPEGDAEKAYRAGRLSFQLHGDKLTGGWHLVRTARASDKKKAWLLFKASDEAARPGDTSLLDEQPNSALSGRDLPAIATGKAGKTKPKPQQIKAPKLERPPRGAELRGVHRVKPELVAEVAYAGITQDGLLRHPTFKGLRDDKPALEVVLEHAVAPPERRKKTNPKPTPTRRSSEKPSALQPTELTHPERVLYPELGLNKRDLAEYFELVSELMLPHVEGRPLTLLRCPEGRTKQCFFQKHPVKSLADGLGRVQVKSSKGTAEYAVIDDVRGLQALVQMSVLEVHIWGAHARDSERPDRLVFDLDPDPEVKFSDVIRAAHAVRALLEELGLDSWVKTTGGKGLHVTVPITAQHGWDEIKAFCQQVAQELAGREPERYVATMSKAKRRGKIFIDYLRNARGATFVAPYSPRAREGAGVAMPVAWSELSAKFKPEIFTVPRARKYLAARKTDPFASLLKARQKLPRWR